MAPHPIKQLLCICCGLFLLTDVLSAQTASVITGKVADHASPGVSLTYWYAPGISPAITQDTLLQKDSFYFRLPATAAREIFFYADAGSGYNFYGLIRAGDSVHMHCQGDSIIFSGTGGVVCRAQYAAKLAQQRVSMPLHNDALTLSEYYRKQLAAGNRVLGVYADSLPATAYAIIRANVLGETAGRLISCLWLLGSDSTLEERQEHFYHEKILPSLPVILPSDTTAMAIRYLDYLLQKSEADYFILHRYECNSRTIYEWIKTHYTGVMRDKLLAHQLLLGFAAGSAQEEMEWCARDYLSLVQDVACKQIIAGRYASSKQR
ncbi:hypothetical protein CLV51_10272 [Chitinophaga niastensis]|uniref:DUF4369 domain-containing protein n=1 Tax=Chitinophaga niastensis TaxID=536980 RepID=A0A2P8HLZ8_CHINA|nr:hypothetical protein [Chitinophaga niastensis]PSL47227.1 hypothetical protein CLV51_10272 [Chitinophaga niastensis]